eukprot:TRINITY_DN16823_c0_g1_i1.p1 TRINITY_DN16823_c0_g1~~TRINITY_DN16823_c0_g1_i1.p1  ORF type:complete len:417 (-),score=122.96 TRINITY_DN16823_c0_g1_i1:105-1355(-)
MPLLPIAAAGSKEKEQLLDEDQGEWEIDPSTVQLGEKVGSGATADVYRAQLKGKTVAAKLFIGDFGWMDPKEKENIKREVKIMRAIEHPRLVNLIGVSSKQRPFTLYIEFCGGGCLFLLLHDQEDISLSQLQGLKMAADTCEAMDFLHKLDPPIIHRDLKSMNLLMEAHVTGPSDPVSVKVSDFGMSRMMNGNVFGKMTIGAGTCHWMAPEVLAGDDYNEKVDVYSFAMVLFEIICREIPFEYEEPAGVRDLVIQGARPDLEAVPPNCPKAMKQLMVQCWNQEREKRPSFEELIKMLEAIQEKILEKKAAQGGVTPRNAEQPRRMDAESKAAKARSMAAMRNASGARYLSEMPGIYGNREGKEGQDDRLSDDALNELRADQAKKATSEIIAGLRSPPNSAEAKAALEERMNQFRTG